MIISEQQLVFLMDVLKDSIKGAIDISGQFSVSFRQRVELYAQILNQQSDKLIEVKDD
jgi:hypothetical protein